MRISLGGVLLYVRHLLGCGVLLLILSNVVYNQHARESDVRWEHHVLW